jgi:hypothetical protein
MLITYHITTPYSSRANGSVERANRELRRTMSKMLADIGMERQQWPELLDIVALILNTAPSDALGGFTPLQADMGRDSKDAVALLMARGADLESIQALPAGYIAAATGELRDALRWWQSRAAWSRDQPASALHLRAQWG